MKRPLSYNYSFEIYAPWLSYLYELLHIIFIFSYQKKYRLRVISRISYVLPDKFSFLAQFHIFNDPISNRLHFDSMFWSYLFMFFKVLSKFWLFLKSTGFEKMKFLSSTIDENVLVLIFYFTDMYQPNLCKPISIYSRIQVP